MSSPTKSKISPAHLPPSPSDLPIVVMAVSCPKAKNHCTIYTHPFPGNHVISKGWGHFFHCPQSCIHCQSPESASQSSTLLQYNTFACLPAFHLHYPTYPQPPPQQTFLPKTSTELSVVDSKIVGGLPRCVPCSGNDVIYRPAKSLLLQSSSLPTLFLRSDSE